MELSLKLSVPLTIALGGWLLGTLNSNRQNEIAQANQKDAVIREYIKEMKGMLLDKTVAKEAKQPGSEANGVARALTLTALTQLKGEGPARRTLVFQFLRESNFPILAGSEKVQGANLVGYDLSEANLSEANLRRANLFGANLMRANLMRANLIRANLWRANLRGAKLIRAKLSGANLIRANLSGANLIRANLSGADLSGANLSGANLWGANLRGADLSGANLSGAKFKDTICPDRKKTDTGCSIPPARQ
jgi:uncharacterized protein YjbI with pentapeptide repeats